MKFEKSIGVALLVVCIFFSYMAIANYWPSISYRSWLTNEIEEGINITFWRKDEPEPEPEPVFILPYISPTSTTIYLDLTDTTSDAERWEMIKEYVSERTNYITLSTIEEEATEWIGPVKADAFIVEREEDITFYTDDETDKSSSITFADISASSDISVYYDTDSVVTIGKGLPYGWEIVSNGRGQYRWKDDTGFMDTFLSDTYDEAVDEAWDFFNFKQEKRKVESQSWGVVIQ